MKSITVRKVPGHTYTMEMEDGRHQLILDEDREEGGEALGPTPYELLLASLGGCTAITLLMYANRKQWAVDDVTVTLTHEKVIPSESDAFTVEEAEEAGPSGRRDLIQMRVLVKGDLDDQQMARLLEIANRCPIHRTLEAAPKITSELVRIV